jgi:predicted O-methyltransferase YrrM
MFEAPSVSFFNLCSGGILRPCLLFYEIEPFCLKGLPEGQKISISFSGRLTLCGLDKEFIYNQHILKMSLFLMAWHRIKSGLRYGLFASHYKGFGVHSPFVFYIILHLFLTRYPFSAFSKTDAAYQMLRQNRQTITTKSFGSSSVYGNKVRRVRRFVTTGSIPPKYGKLLFRLINHFEARDILELGTGLGLGTLYLALPDSRSRIVSIDANSEMSAMASQLLEVTGVENVQLVTGQFKIVLPDILKDKEKLDFVFFDGDHKREPTLQYFNLCLQKKHNDTIFVFDDIHWSRDMEQAWQDIVNHPEVTVSLDLFRIGIVFFRHECKKQHYVVRF